MADEILKRDQNHVTVLAGITDDANQFVTMLRVDPITKRLLISATGLPGTGDVNGPASSTDNAIVRFDGTTGKIIQNSGVIVSDTNDVTGMATLTLPNTGLHLLDTNASHDLIIVPGSDLTADRNLTIVTGDAARTLTLSGNFTGSGSATGTNTGDQNLFSSIIVATQSTVTASTTTTALTLVAGSGVTITTDNTAKTITFESPASGGTVTTVSVVTANGFAGTVANATSTPAITLTTTITGILQGNGTAISAASTTGSGSVVLATSPTLVTPTLGVASATSINKVAITAPATSATLTLANGSTLATSGANSITLTSAGATNVTLPTSGTLATLAGSEAFSNKTSITMSTGGGVRTGTSAGNTLLIQAFDVDGAAYTTFATLTANNTPTMDLNTAVTINGAQIYRVGGTDVALADGGTGTSLSDPGANTIMGWDNTDNLVEFFNIGTGLTYTHATHTLSVSQGSINPATTSEFFDDFINVGQSLEDTSGDQLTLNSTGTWAIQGAGGSGTLVNPNDGETNHPGIVSIQDSSYMVLGGFSAPSSTVIYPLGPIASADIVEFCLNHGVVSTADQFDVLCGTVVATLTDDISFEYNSDSGLLRGTVAGVGSTSTTAVTIDSYNRYRIVVGVGSVEFFLNGVTMGTVSGSLSTDPQSIIIRRITSLSSSNHVDYVYFRRALTR